MVYTQLVHSNKQDRQCTYNLRSEAHLHNLYCHEQTISIKYYMCVCVCLLALLIDHVKHISPAPYYTVVCGLSGSTIFFHNVS